ncbi:RNA polymerase sigma-70 factor [Draconibacterium sp. IB214405]|uniref:RNA polymerase sigma factor n=1 Tax=Draconibacterium sp. IB214405 TaxID=3097352 RepID=UPI002A15D01F|nr:RNA polymerase sigma-70 factor [Draconibacterium sp. IB214405]MDX8341165.1 RNA polymerase sigma-70 factor [Draconibacterium sp. IB214405]
MSKPINDTTLDIELVKKLQKGDVEAFDRLFSNYGKRLYHFAYGYLKSKEDAEGVVQEVFLRVWRNRKQLKSDLSFKAYLFKIAYHYILELFEQINRRKAYQHQIIDETVSFTDDTNERLNYQILLEKVETLIGKLPSRQREVLIKRKKEGIPVKEIAKQLRVSPKTVENHLTEALKNIKKGLGEEDISAMLFFLLFVKP